MAESKLEDLPAYPAETTLTLIGNKWQVLILRDLNLHGSMRFKELFADSKSPLTAPRRASGASPGKP